MADPERDDSRRRAGVPLLISGSPSTPTAFSFSSFLLGPYGIAAFLALLGVASAAYNVLRSPTLDGRRAGGAAFESRAGAAAGESRLVDGADPSKDGMAYITNRSGTTGGGDSGDTTAGVPERAGEDSSQAAAGADGLGAGRAEAHRGAMSAEALAAEAKAAAAAIGGGGTAAPGPASSARPQLAKVQGFAGASGGGGGGASGGGAGGGAAGNAGLGKSSAFREGVDAAVRQAVPAKTGGRERLVASGRHTGGLEKSQGVKNLLGMARSMQGDKSGSEGGSSRQTLGFDSTQPIGNQLGLALPGGRGPHDGGRTSGGGTGGGSAGETGPVWRETEGLDQDTLTDPEVPEVGPTKNVTPYQWAIDTAKFIMAAIMALAIASAIAKKTKVGIGALKVIYKLTAALGAILGVLGCYMIAQGQYLQGTIWTVLGAVTAVIALKNLDETGKAPEQASKEAIEDKGREVAKKWEGAHEGQTEWGKAANQNTPDTFRQFTDNTGKYTQSFNSKTGELTSTFTDKAGNTWKWVRTDMPYAPQRSGFLGHFVSGTYQTTATNVVGSFVPAATGGGSFATLALTGTALGHEINEERNRKKDDNRERREKYVREQGVDPDTKRIVDRKTFEKLHGRGSAERYEKKHGFDDPNQRRMRYIEKTGIDPETNLVVDKEVFEARYGKGAADKWNEDHKDLDA